MENNNRTKKEVILAEGEKKRQAWLEKNGFDADGYTYILIGLDTYAIKEELKEKGYKYNSFLRWHSASPAGYEENVYKMHWTEAYQTTAWGDMYPIEGIQAKVDNLIDEAKPKSPSEWVGEIGDKLKEIKVKLTYKYSFETRYGMSTGYHFVTEDGNVLVWFSSTVQQVESGDWCIIKYGTIKNHNEYKNVKQTVLTRCKISSC